MGWATACASQGAPTGGPEDRRPPVVVRTEPEAFAVLTDLDGEVRFHFDERISEQAAGGRLEDAVTVSPSTGEVRVGHGRRMLSVRVEGGFRSGQIYRVTVQPAVRDLFGNQLRDPFELVFSTGGGVEPAATATLAGQIWDRVTGRGVDGASVEAVGADSVVHVARADGQGIYAFRYLPTGSFTVTGYQDLDRDGEVDARETQGSVPLDVAPGDTLIVDLPLLAPDTTAPEVLFGRVLDSVTVAIEFDDYLDPDTEADAIGVRLEREDGDAPLVARLFDERAYDAYVDQVEDSFARLDSLAAAESATPPADSAGGVDSLGPDPSGLAADANVPADTTQGDAVAATDTTAAPAAPAPAARRLPPRLGGARGGASVQGRVLPGRRVVGLLDRPLDADTEYTVRISSVVNVNGLGGGGGEVTLRYDPAAVAVEPERAPDGGDAPRPRGAPADGLPDAGRAAPPGGGPSPLGGGPDPAPPGGDPPPIPPGSGPIPPTPGPGNGGPGR